MSTEPLLLGVDGGATLCRARLQAMSGELLGESMAGPANIRLDLQQSFSAVLQATTQCLRQAGLAPGDLARIVACLALAGASEPAALAQAQQYGHPFRKVTITTDARAACIGAHGGRDGGVLVVGTGTVGWAELAGRSHRVGGWGPAVSDEGGGAWLGCEALRRVLWAHDGRTPWTPLLTAVFEQYEADPHAIVSFSSAAAPRDFGALAPVIVEHASNGDSAAVELMRLAAGHVDGLAQRLMSGRSACRWSADFRCISSAGWRQRPGSISRRRLAMHSRERYSWRGPRPDRRWPERPTLSWGSRT
jgi:glucosamine kinase